MNLSSGIPLASDVQKLLATDYYRQHLACNAGFLERHGKVMASYRKRWEDNPYTLWSRRWEYPWAAQRILEHADQRGRNTPMALLDAGSGVTYLPHFLCQQIPGLSVVACDYDTSYVPMFESICHAEGSGRVSFREADMRQLPFASRSFDLVLCVSVLEHTDQYPTILREFGRVLKGGGLMVLTFDLSLDDKFELSRAHAAALLQQLQSEFTPLAPQNPVAELSAIDRTDQILTTDAVKKSNPELLPWKRPMLKAAHDLLKGHGWTGGFRSKSVYCVAVRAPG